jgi:ATP-dependent helicase/nuclease subunit B
MSLRIVYGRAGSGKTSYCLKDIKSKLENNEKNLLILIVPEQFSLQAERNLIKIIGRGGILRAEVLSFRRMANRVFNEVGGLTRRHLNSAGKCMMLFRIIDGMKGGLKVFSRAALQKGFAGTISEIIAEFKRYDVTVDKLFNAAEGMAGDSPLKEKLDDIGLIYSEFDRSLHERYLDSDDDLTELYNRLDRSGQFNDSEIWIDEFSGFTPQEYKVIKKLLEKARRVNICLCTDFLETEANDASGLVFSPVRNTAAKLRKLAGESGIAVELPIKLGGAGKGCEKQISRFSNSSELSHLEHNFYSYPFKKYYEMTRDVCIFSAANIFSEVEDAARNIIRLCRDQETRYRDIAVVSRSLDKYEKVICSVFKEYGIPYFIDRKRDISSHPLTILILSVLEIFNSSWS